MPKVTVVAKDKTVVVEVAAGQNLLGAIQAAGLPIAAPCGGQKKCGKCVVAARGALSAATAQEQAFQIGEGLRLACFATVQGDCTVTLPEKRGAVIEAAYAPWQGELAPLYTGGYGAAFDIGTTTVAGQLFAPGDKKPLAVAGRLNAQQPYGGDVITRTVYCNENGVASLQGVIRRQLSEMLNQLCAEGGIAPAELRHMVVCGNTTMLYILYGISPRPLAMAPFTMEHPFGGEFPLELEGFEHLNVTVPGCVSAYVGADITCSVLASGIAQGSGNLLLVDAGTNGEMALHTNDALTCCSTAAGPAFEGAGIACGGNAAPGAIDSVQLEDGQVKYTTIGGVPATHLCGSGIIDAAAVLYTMGLIDDSGRLSVDGVSGKEVKYVFAGSEVFLCQKDIRQLQLAKAAIRAGMDTLIAERGLDYGRVDGIILCGGFGSYLRPRSAECIGLIPPGFAGKAKAIGNAAGNGAGQILQSTHKLAEAAAMVKRMEAVELGSHPVFSQRFIEAMAFGEDEDD